MANEDFVSLYFSAAQISARLSAMHNGRGAFSRSPLVASRARILPYWCNAIELPSLHNRTSSADALRLCKPSVFISRPAISSRAFRLSSPGPPFLLLFIFYFILFVPFSLSRFDPRTRSVVYSFAIQSEDSRPPLFVSRYREISRKEYAAESLMYNYNIIYNY